MNQNRQNQTIHDIKYSRKITVTKKYSFVLSNIMIAIMKSAGQKGTV
jgi:hypothetical protein